MIDGLRFRSSNDCEVKLLIGRRGDIGHYKAKARSYEGIREQGEGEIEVG